MATFNPESDNDDDGECDCHGVYRRAVEARQPVFCSSVYRGLPINRAASPAVGTWMSTRPPDCRPLNRGSVHGCCVRHFPRPPKFEVISNLIVGLCKTKMYMVLLAHVKREADWSVEGQMSGGVCLQHVSGGIENDCPARGVECPIFLWL